MESLSEMADKMFFAIDFAGGRDCGTMTIYCDGKYMTIAEFAKAYPDPTEHGDPGDEDEHNHNRRNH